MRPPASLQLGTPPSPYRDPRSAPRIDVTDRLRGAVAGSGQPLRVRDISFGGCRVESETPFEVGSLQQFRLETLDDAVRLTLTARVVYSRADCDRQTVFVTGVRFVGPWTRDEIGQFDRLMDALTSVLSFD